MMTDKIIAMVITFLGADAHIVLIVSRIPRGVEKILWKKLTCFMELVVRALNELSSQEGVLVKRQVHLRNLPRC